MNPYHRYRNNHFILFVWLTYLNVSTFGQTVYIGDSITLNAVDYVAGELQWQYSFDDEEWFDFEGGNGLRHVIYPEQDVFLRLQITDFDCLPAYYTETKFVELMPRPFVCGDSLEDPRDGQLYPTIEIGAQCWMARNLNIGSMISGSSNQTDVDVIEKYCYGNNPENCEKYGGLYQWNQAMMYSEEEGTQGVCPPGWHLPAEDEWQMLEKELGMNESVIGIIGFRGGDVGDALKAGGSSGFEALMGGGRNSFGGWQFIEGSDIEFGYFYSSTLSQNPAYVFRRCLRKDQPGVGRYDTWTRTYGLSVRCVKDD